MKYFMKLFLPEEKRQTEREKVEKLKKVVENQLVVVNKISCKIGGLHEKCLKIGIKFKDIGITCFICQGIFSVCSFEKINFGFNTN